MKNAFLTLDSGEGLLNAGKGNSSWQPTTPDPKRTQLSRVSGLHLRATPIFLFRTGWNETQEQQRKWGGPGEALLQEAVYNWRRMEGRNRNCECPYSCWRRETQVKRKEQTPTHTPRASEVLLLQTTAPGYSLPKPPAKVLFKKDLTHWNFDQKNGKCFQHRSIPSHTKKKGKKIKSSEKNIAPSQISPRTKHIAMNF